MTDATGTVAWSADYKPFGEATVTVSTITNNLRFPGQYYDAETGLNYNYYRDYNPALGRYIETDPIGLSGGINLFVYVANSPIKLIDELGLVDPTACQISLSAGRMTCTSYGMTIHQSGGWVSGQGGQCQNNPSPKCLSQPFIGPAPIGRYISTGPPIGRPTTRNNLLPNPNNSMYGRPVPGTGGFQTHYCRNPEYCSEGCIAQTDWTVMQDFNNVLGSFPNMPITVVR
jgi:RHS repeat-associated protein